MSDPRQQQLATWAAARLAITTPKLQVVSGDASFRRYFRFQHNNQSIIAVDAPPEHENNLAFQTIGEILYQQGLHVPQFHHIDLKQGFILLSDLGDQLYLPTLTSSNADEYYQKAIHALIKIQLTPANQVNHLPCYDAKMLNYELELFNEWFIEQYLELALTPQEQAILKTSFKHLTTNATQQAQTLVHRDYHSRNLMVCGKETPGIIDFQDAVIGPISYDLVSLLKDCYIHWPSQRVKSWVKDYHQAACDAGLTDNNFKLFYQQFEWMGMQRHIKVLGIFSRLKIREKKSGYLKDIPVTFKHLLEASQKYTEFTDLQHLLIDKIKPALDNMQTPAAVQK